MGGQPSSFYIPGLFCTVTVTNFRIKTFLILLQWAHGSAGSGTKFTAMVTVVVFLVQLQYLSLAEIYMHVWFIQILFRF